MSMSIGTKIKSIRELKNYTQEYVADRLEMTQAGYSKIEKGSTSLSFEKLEQLAIILELPIADIINFDIERYFRNRRSTEKEQTYHTDKNTIIKRLYEDKIVLLERLLGKTDSELRFYKDKFGVL
ncbi:helix-turn-helix domain-containing protein [Flavobacterium sp. LC2016-23]|nr:helix-turn-helix domain-containing protein [Flavobacterium sp. LC2016-23]